MQDMANEFASWGSVVLRCQLCTFETSNIAKLTAVRANAVKAEGVKQVRFSTTVVDVLALQQVIRVAKLRYYLERSNSALSASEVVSRALTASGAAAPHFAVVAVDIGVDQQRCAVARCTAENDGTEEDVGIVVVRVLPVVSIYNVIWRSARAANAERDNK